MLIDMSQQATGWSRAGQAAERPLIRKARQDDLDALILALGQWRYFSDSLARQRAGLGTLLVAWLDMVPVGSVYLRTEPADEPELREHLPGVPLLNHLEVCEERRNRGTGTRLLAEAERLLRVRGHRRVALAVEVNNIDALRLYLRLGYRDWGHSRIVCTCDLPPAGGGAFRDTETCHVLVKRLRVEGRPEPPPG